MHRLSLIAVAALLVGCARTVSAPPVPAASAAPPLLVLERQSGYRRDFAPGTARLELRVRSADYPTRDAQGAQLWLTRAGDDAPARPAFAATADSLGAATMDSLPAGDFTLHVRRIGYETHSVPLSLPASCPVTV